MRTSRTRRAHKEFVAGYRRLLAAISEDEATSGWARAGTASFAAWVARECDESYASAREWVDDAHALQERPALDAAAASGEVSCSQMRAIAVLAPPDTDDDEVWLELLGTPDWDLRALQREARKQRARQLEHEDGGVYLRFRTTRDERHMQIRWQVDYEDGASVMRQIDRRVDGSGRMSSIDHARSEALLDLVRSGGRAGRPELVVRIDPNDTVGRVDGGGFLSRATVERLACDATVRPIIESGGRAVGVGRGRRVVPAWLEGLVRDRDQTCTYHGCERAAMVDIHHIKHWLRDEGPTDLSNLLLTCHYHHKLLHEYGWRLEGEAGPGMTWIAPDGTRHKRGSARIDSS